MLIPWVYFLKDDEQLLVERFTRRETFNGPGVFPVLAPHRGKVRKGITLGPTEYMRVRDVLTGQNRNELGPKLYFLKASEEVQARLLAIALKKNQYVQIVDKSTGIIRVERGESLVYLTPTEEQLGEIQVGINIDDENAVLVRDIVSGQLDLVTEPQVFIPSATQWISEVRQRIRLADHETVIIKDKLGQYVFRRGSDTERSFFLEPYAELVELHWSTGIHKDKRGLIISRFDLRPKFMWYEFEARTQDNVELVIGVTFFWEVIDIEAMIKKTDDTPGDICSHARSSIIQAVSQVTLERFLAAFNEIVRSAVLRADDNFYSERGVEIRAIEVRSITCKDAATQHILQEIIQETTNRLNRLQKQESENEVSLRRLSGEIEVEQAKGQLLTVRTEHMRLEGRMVGEAEAEKVRGFLEGFADTIPLADRIAIFNTLRKQDALEKLSKGSAQIFFTPADVDLSIKTGES
jgi:regulator of protease activity HflC (stomatin/prohibitin superfamily)